MEPTGTQAAVTQRLRLAPRKVAIVAGALVALIAVIVAVVVITGRSGPPDQEEVAAELEAAISELAPGATVGSSGSAGSRFDTGALRARLETRLEGWNVDLAAGSDGSRVGAAARQIEGTACVFAWSDVGASQSAVVNDPDLPCVAEIALIPAKNPA